MSIKKGLLGAIGLSLLALGLHLPAKAQTAIETEPAIADAVVAPTNNEIADLTFNEPTLQLADLTFSESQIQSLEQAEASTEGSELTAEAATTATAIPEVAITEALPAEELIAVESNAIEPMQPVTEAAELAYPAAEVPEEIAQIRRRRTRGGPESGANYIGIGADIGYADDLGFAAISKFSFNEKWAIRPTVILGDGFSVLVPVTYDFSRFGTAVSGFQLKPYAGAGASYSDSDDDSDLNLLLSAGVDVPVSDRFTANAQVNWGVLNDSQLGVTVGVGYNFGSDIFR